MTNNKLDFEAAREYSECLVANFLFVIQPEKRLHNLAACYLALSEQVEAYEAALEFYAGTHMQMVPCPDGREGCCVSHYSPAPNYDHGDKAIQVLEKYKKENV